MGPAKYYEVFPEIRVSEKEVILFKRLGVVLSAVWTTSAIPGCRYPDLFFENFHRVSRALMKHYGLVGTPKVPREFDIDESYAARYIFLMVTCTRKALKRISEKNFNWVFKYNDKGNRIVDRKGPLKNPQGGEKEREKCRKIFLKILGGKVSPVIYSRLIGLWEEMLKKYITGRIRSGKCVEQFPFKKKEKKVRWWFDTLKDGEKLKKAHKELGNYFTKLPQLQQDNFIQAAFFLHTVFEPEKR